MLAAARTDQQRAKLAVGFAPPADDHLMPRPAFGLRPGIASPRGVWRGEPFRYDSFERHSASGAQHGISSRLKMLDKSDERVRLFVSGEEGFQLGFAIG